MLQLRTDYLHLCRMSWRIIMRNIVPYFMKTVETFYLPLRLRTIGKWMQPRYRVLQTLKRHTIPTAANLLGYCISIG